MDKKAIKKGFREFEQRKERNQQDKNNKLVQREVFCCVSSEVSFILSCSQNPTTLKDIPFTDEDIENLFYTYEQALENGMIDKDTTKEEYDPEMQEIYEYWKVSKWLMEKLAEKGEPVIRDYNIWCRTCTGQSIILDNVITDIQQESKYMDG